ncbi:hypothetical protein GCM10017044_00980 [Kordiimonas sediminis]|uniref:Uncharacterized protein n=1 Tax=Kordiimonas sediminis TaxID=1735581 RepID=A0A919E3S8_9PROT|nr:hypothetical protein GCM10017044_00980 [Kordiimonas sediminis]
METVVLDIDPFLSGTGFSAVAAGDKARVEIPIANTATKGKVRFFIRLSPVGYRDPKNPALVSPGSIKVRVSGHFVRTIPATFAHALTVMTVIWTKLISLSARRVIPPLHLSEKLNYMITYIYTDD